MTTNLRGVMIRSGAMIAVCAVAFCLVGCIAGGNKPLDVWVVGGEQPLSADSEPSPQNDVYSAADKSIRLTAAVNETVDIQVALRTSAPPAGPYTLAVSDLTGPAGSLSAAEIARIYRARPVRVERFESWYPAHAGKPASPTSFLDMLVPWGAPRGGGPLRLDGRGAEVIWIDLHVPPTTSPGEYQGKIELLVEKAPAPAYTATIYLTVAPVVIPGERSLPIVCRVDPVDLLAGNLGWPRNPAEATRILPDDASHAPAQALVNATMRLLHEHRTTPVLWGSFPKFQLASANDVEVEWPLYDGLVRGWLSGEAFADRVGLAAWAVPASVEYPDAQRNGGFASPRYARLLSGYVAASGEHFRQEGWAERSFVRLFPPAPLTAGNIERVQRLARILKQNESAFPFISHLPARSLAGLGWHQAPAIDIPETDIWAPVGMAFEPEAMAQQRSLGKRVWFAPDHPPYSPSLAVEAPATDATLIPWVAYRYGVQGVWVEHATEIDLAGHKTPPGTPPATPLVYSGKDYGLREEVLPSIRLKRLRRGQQDYELLHMLEASGRALLAQRVAERVAGWAFTDACLEDLLTTREAGWASDPRIPAQARAQLLQELAGAFAAQGGAADWNRLLARPTEVWPRIRGVRLTQEEERISAKVFTAVINGGDRPLNGKFSLPEPPVGWQLAGGGAIAVSGNGRVFSALDLSLETLAFNVAGVFPFRLSFDSTESGSFETTGRLAALVCPLVTEPPRIDGDLADWASAGNNSAADFRLCLVPENQAVGSSDQPQLATQAIFCVDAEKFYIGVRCSLNPGEPPQWEADNVIPLDGAVPWGQDLVEILIDPREKPAATSADLFLLQIKPSGLLVSRKGALTDPPIGASESWQSGAMVAARVRGDAWTVEAAVPLEALGAAASRSRVWGLNVTRLDSRRGEYSSWSGARGHCYGPATLGNLVLLRP